MHDLFSNAPAQWPQVRVEGLIASQVTEVKTANTLNIASTVETKLRAAGLEVLESSALRLTCQGMLEVPLRIRQGEEYDLFFYPQADERAAAHYAALRELEQSCGRLRPLYFCPSDLSLVRPLMTERVTQLERLYIESAPLAVQGQYAMWWADSEGERFHLSPSYDLYDRIYRELNGLEMRAFAQILCEVGQIREEYEFTASTLTDSTIELTVQGPEGVPMLITFSQQRGIRFHFHMGLTPPKYRDLYLNMVLMRTKQWKTESGLDQIKRLDSPSYIWWRELGKRFRFTSGDQAIAAVGSVKR